MFSLTKKTTRKSLSRNLKLESLANRSLMAADVFTMGMMDFGDAPDSYGTTLESDGARHVAGGPRLGSSVDSEFDGLPSATATRDGADEDGVRFIGSTVQVIGTGVLDAWADSNLNGRFDAGEQFIKSAPLSNGFNYFDAPEGNYFRFRVSVEGGLGPTGFGGLGEVEDYGPQPDRTNPPKDPVPPPHDNPHDPVPPPADPPEEVEREDDEERDPESPEPKRQDVVITPRSEGSRGSDESTDALDSIFAEDYDWRHPRMLP